MYARVDGVDTYSPDVRSLFAGQEVALFDAVNADWFDEVRRGSDGKLADAETVDEADWRVSALEVRRRDLEAFVGDVEGVDWLALELGEYGEPLTLQYLNLFAAPTERRLERAERVEPDLDRELADKTSMDDIDDASANELDAILARLPEPDAVAVYDVGQGGCSAAVAGGTPRLYYDFGGGVLGNRRTFPPGLGRFCFTEDPPVVLSHWDWDHWSSANRDPRAQAQTWIVPRQGGRKGLGAVHRTFLGRLLQRGRVLVWPQGLPSLRAGAYELLACTGTTRNDGGLALALERTVGWTTGRILLPGDCAYHRIPGAGSAPLLSIVAAHHGGRTKSTLIPKPDGSAEGRLVYSYGRDNTYRPSVRRGPQRPHERALVPGARDGRALTHPRRPLAGRPDARARAPLLGLGCAGRAPVLRRVGLRPDLPPALGARRLDQAGRSPSARISFASASASSEIGCPWPSRTMIASRSAGSSRPVSSQWTLTPSFGASLRSAFTDGRRKPASMRLM